MSNYTNPYRQRYHKIDGWRGYPIPARAVAGASDTGTWDDSPCPTPQVKAELKRFQRECLRPHGIHSRIRHGSSSNVFCGKHWIVVCEFDQFERAAQLAADWLEEHRYDTRFIHDADLAALGYTPKHRGVQPGASPKTEATHEST